MIAAGHRATRAVLFSLFALFVLVAAGDARAATITGSVRNEAGVGLANVDLDFINLCGGDNIFLAGDKSAADGTYSIVVPNGTYDVHYTPPAGSTVAAADRHDLVVTASADLGVTTLHPGRLVSGTVKTPGLAAAVGVDLKFVDRATDHRVYLSKDVTNASGQYSLRVPPGSYDIDYRPPTALAFVDAERLGLVVGASDIAGLVDTLRSGFQISGTVQDKHNTKLKNVDIDVFDQCTGKRIPTAHDNTDANGNYSIMVPTGTYTFNYDPPRCVAVAAARSTNVIVDRSRNFGTEQLADAVLVSGTVHDHTGQPCVDAKLKFYDATAVGAPRQAATNDRTDATGAFSVYLPTGTYEINIEPPVGVVDQVGHIASVGVSGALNVGVVQLTAGVALSGHVVGPGSAPALNVNINVVDSQTRAAQRLAHDDTDAAGDFTVVVAPGTYDVQYDPPACDGLAPTSQNSRTVSSATTLPTVALVTGVHALGTVVDALSAPVPNVDLDLYPAGTTAKIYTPNDQTAADGTYDVLMPPASYDVKYIPSSTTRLRPAALLGAALSSTQTLPTVVLASGWFVSGVVRDTLSLVPIADVAVDFYAPGSPTPLWTPHHLSGPTGAYNVAIDAGTWNIHFTPPPASPYGPAWRMGIAVSADTPLPEVGLAVVPVDVPASTSAPRALAIWPNPARGSIRMTFGPVDGDADLSILDLAGRRVATPWRGRAASPVTVQWNGAGDDGVRLPSGVYYARVSGRNGLAFARRLVVLK